MPLVRIAHAAGKSPAYRQAIADGVHDALVGTLHVPADDRFQIINEQAGGSLIFDENFLGIRRSAELVFIQVFLRRGRSIAMKQDFYRQVARNLTANPGLAANDIFITLSENELADWSFGQGRAQYVEQPPSNLPTVDATPIDVAPAEPATVAPAAGNPPGAVAKAGGSLLAAGIVMLGLVAIAHILAPARIDAALAAMPPTSDPVAMAAFTA